MAEILIYHENGYPRGLLGPAELLWQPIDAPHSSKRKLWIRLHPSIFSEAFEVFQRTSTLSDVVVSDLRGEVGGLEIMGPMAGKVIRRVFRICRSEPAEKKEVGYVYFV
jgi:ribonuclease P/MRP protein subunit POP1